MQNGIFGRANGLAGSIFDPRAGGPLGALGTTTGGIFGTRGSLGGLGAVDVPAACWDKPGFKDAHDQCFAGSQAAAYEWQAQGPDATMGPCKPGMTFDECVDALHGPCLQQTIADFGGCAGGGGTTTTTTPPSGGGTKPGGGGGGGAVTTYQPPSPGLTPPATAQPGLMDSAIEFAKKPLLGLPTGLWILVGGALVAVGIAKARG